MSASTQGSQVFDSTFIAEELQQARANGREMIRGALGIFVNGDLYEDDLPFLGFIERAQALHLGVVDMVERGNPIAAVTLLRALAENVAVVFYVKKHPHEVDKPRPGATKGLPIGRVVAEAEKNLPGFKQLYDHWSGVAHPSGA